MPAVMERPVKDERVHARLRPDQKEFLEKCALATGLSLSGFILTSALREARRIFAEQRTTLTREEAMRFRNLLLDPPAPSETAVASLRKARRWPSKVALPETVKAAGK